MMGVLSLILLLAADESGATLAKTMLPIYVQEVEAYSLAVEAAPQQTLELRKEPVLQWLNPARSNQQGAIFLWLRDGRPAALGCIFSAARPQLGGRLVFHELHALDPEKLVVKRDAYNQWKPQAGLARAELPDAPAPAPTAAPSAMPARGLRKRRPNSIPMNAPWPRPLIAPTAVRLTACLIWALPSPSRSTTQAFLKIDEILLLQRAQLVQHLIGGMEPVKAQNHEIAHRSILC